jgi:Kdo2-lipid IVA lauroyltransferase/acyltransferase
LDCGGKPRAKPPWMPAGTAPTWESKTPPQLVPSKYSPVMRYTHPTPTLPLMSKSSLQINLEYLVASSLLTIFGWLPLRMAISAGSTLGRGAYYCSGRLRRTGQRNLELAFPDLALSERRRLLHGCFQSLGRLLGVFSQFETADTRALQSVVECEGLEHIDAARQSGRGVILFTGHVGAWELTSFALSLFDYPLSFLVRRIDNPKIEKLVDERRERLGNRTIDKRSAAREMLQTLQGGGTLGILVDLNTLDREGIFVDFFGVPASTTFMLAKLALRTEAAVLPVFAPWDRERQCFLLKIGEPLTVTRSSDNEDDVRCLTQLFTSVVEKYVRRYPDQWLWIHRRWKTRPSGEPGIYD